MAHLVSEPAFSKGDFTRRIAELEKQVKQLQTARRLEAASIGAGGLTVKGGHIIIEDSNGNETMRLATDGLTLEGFLQVIGSIGVSGDVHSDGFVEGESGYRLEGNGNAEFNSLTLRDGIIGIEALTEPVAVVSKYAEATGFNVTTTEQDIVSDSVSVPSWATNATLIVNGGIWARNNTGSPDALFARARTHTISGAGLRMSVDHTWDDSLSPAASNSFPNPPSSMNFGVRAWTQGATWTSPGGGAAHIAYAYAVAIFTR